MQAAQIMLASNLVTLRKLNRTASSMEKVIKEDKRWAVNLVHFCLTRWACRLLLNCRMLRWFIRWINLSYLTGRNRFFKLQLTIHAQRVFVWREYTAVAWTGKIQSYKIKAAEASRCNLMVMRAKIRNCWLWIKQKI